MYRRIQTTAFVVGIAILFSGLALAQHPDDDNDSSHHKDRQHESKRDHDRDHDREHHDNGLHKGQYKHDGDTDRDDHGRYERHRDQDDHHWRDRDDRNGNRGNQGTYGNAGYANNPGYNQGYQDGSRVGQSDMAHGKPFNSYPRGVYRTSDHGYHSGYGNKGAYQESYLRGYETGYRSSYRRAPGR